MTNTVLMLWALWDAVASGSTWTAMKRMAHALDVEAVETWFRLQAAAIQWVDGDLQAGRITAEQHTFITDWLTNLDRYETNEAVALLTAWEEWVTPAA